MEGKNELIEKYSISEQDLYTLGVIEEKKSKAGLWEKQKLTNMSNTVVKPYNVALLDTGVLYLEIRDRGFHNDQTLINKYGPLNLETIKGDSSGAIKFILIMAVIGAIIGGVLALSESDSASNVGDVKSDSALNVGDVNQRLTNIYSGDYKGQFTNPTGLLSEYKVSVDPIKFVKKGQYEAFVTGHGVSPFGTVVSLKDSKLKILVSGEDEGDINTNEICLYTKGGGMFGNPCDGVNFDEKGIRITATGDVLSKVENRFYRQDLNNPFGK